MDSSQIIILAIPVFFLLIICEYFYGAYTKKNTYRINDAFTSISIGIISRFPTLLNLGFQGLIFVYFAEKFSINLMASNKVITWVVAFIMYDFFYYWMHRFHHEIRVLWATHVVHHHGEDFNLATALRQTSTGFLWKWIFFAPMIMVGVPGEVFVSVAGVNLVYQFWVHTRHIGHLGWMEKIFVTPMNHRIHHAKNKEYIDANYGGVFILWDRIFGTYKAEVETIAPIYGTVSALRSWNPIWANFQVFYQMFKDSLETRNLKDKIRIWYSRTNWRPNDIQYKDKTYGFDEKYNPVITTDMKCFVFFQLIMLILVSAFILLTISDQTRFDTVIFAISTTYFATLTGMLLQIDSITYKLFLIYSLCYALMLYLLPSFKSLHGDLWQIFFSYSLMNILITFFLILMGRNSIKLLKQKEI
ncbi:MAG: sterol desaturase family protein [Pseudomonadota bacterium]|nr:sterol desaturase family protein [Pseudomonadota bacterium]